MGGRRRLVSVRQFWPILGRRLHSLLPSVSRPSANGFLQAYTNYSIVTTSSGNHETLSGGVQIIAPTTRRGNGGGELYPSVAPNVHSSTIDRALLPPNRSGSYLPIIASWPSIASIHISSSYHAVTTVPLVREAGYLISSGSGLDEAARDLQFRRRFHSEPWDSLSDGTRASGDQSLENSPRRGRRSSRNSGNGRRYCSASKGRAARRALAEAAASDTPLAEPETGTLASSTEVRSLGSSEARFSQPESFRLENSEGEEFGMSRAMRECLAIVESRVRRKTRKARKPKKSAKAGETGGSEFERGPVDVTEAVNVIEEILCDRFGPDVMRLDGGEGTVNVLVWEGTGNHGQRTKVGEEEEASQEGSVDRSEVSSLGDITSSNSSSSSGSSRIGSSSSSISSSTTITITSSSDSSDTNTDTSSTSTGPKSRRGRPRRTTTHGTLINLYEFFSSLGIHDPTVVAGIIASCPAFLKPQPLSHLHQKISFLKSQGVSSSDIAKLIVLDAGWLRSSLAGLQQSVLFLRSAGVEEEMLGAVLLLSPRLLCLPSTTMAETLRFLKGLLGEDATTRVLLKFPMVLTKNARNLEPKIELLGRMLGAGLVNKIIERFPPVLNASSASLEKNFGEWCTVFQGVKRLPEGLRWNLGDLTAYGEQNSEEEKNHGEGSEEREGEGEGEGEGKQGKNGKEGKELSNGLLKDSAARHVVCQFVTFWPYALFYNWQRNIAPKLHYLQHNMKLPVIELLRFPTFLTLGLNRRIKPRHLALKKNGYVVKPHEEVLGSRSGDGEAEAGAKESVTGFGKRERKAVCLSQFLPCNDAVFRKRFLQAGEQHSEPAPAPAAAPLLSN